MHVYCIVLSARQVLGGINKEPTAIEMRSYLIRPKESPASKSPQSEQKSPPGDPSVPGGLCRCLVCNIPVGYSIFYSECKVSVSWNSVKLKMLSSQVITGFFGVLPPEWARGNRGLFELALAAEISILTSRRIADRGSAISQGIPRRGREAKSYCNRRLGGPYCWRQARSRISQASI